MKISDIFLYQYMGALGECTSEQTLGMLENWEDKVRRDVRERMVQVA